MIVYKVWIKRNSAVSGFSEGYIRRQTRVLAATGGAIYARKQDASEVAKHHRKQGDEVVVEMYTMTLKERA